MIAAVPNTAAARVPNWRHANTRVWSLQDGVLRVNPEALDISESDIARAPSVCPREPFDIPVNVFLVMLDGKRILVDAGGGSWANSALGHTLTALKHHGHSGGDIDLILLTHLHPDHVTGLINEAGTPIYPRATLVMHEREFDFWLRANRSAMSERTRRNAVLVERAFAPYRDRIRPTRSGDDSVPGLTALGLPGHTPGHTGWRLDAGETGLLFWGDIVHASTTQLRLPDTAIMFDVDPDAARRTRHQILSSLAERNTTVAGAHLPDGGIGTIARDGDGFRFVSLRYHGVAP
jgi:glyoxylase-like metal-dependent hydrolase (beta-lactamase superfamily II)